MPWVPTTDFEEEIVNLQPNHDFIYGVLSEPEYSYPRPKAHTEYAANKKVHTNDQNSKISSKLHVVQQVQLMANTNAAGEQPCLEEWENNEMAEQETIGMMRFCGMGASIEQPLDKKVTISTFPVDNTIKVVKNGRKKVALFFDDNVFKFQEKPSDISTELNYSPNGESYKSMNNDSLSSELEDDISFNTSSSISFSTARDFNDSFASSSSCQTPSLDYLNEKPLHQYEKLLEDTALLSLDSSAGHSSNSSSKENSFETSEEITIWRPIYEREEDFLCNKKENWPVLSKKKSLTDASDKKIQNKTQSNTTSKTSDCNQDRKERKNFLDRFIKTENADELDNTDSQESNTYAAIAKASKVKPQQPNSLSVSVPYYMPRIMFERKRNAK